MGEFFDIEVLPAQRGDSLWIEYGNAQQTCRILIDGGITRTGRDLLVKRVADLGPRPHFDLVIVTHIDLDHILGVIAMFKELPADAVVDRVWFNGWDQLPADPLVPQGVAEGIELSGLIAARHAAAWNKKAIALDANGKPTVHPLPLTMMVTVLSPNVDKLLALQAVWEPLVEEFGVGQAAADEGVADEDLEIPGLVPMGPEEIDVVALAESKFKEDDTVPNGSSIAVMLEFAGKRALMLADAHPKLVLGSIQALSPAGRLHVDCVKLSHHGSRNNTHRELIQALQSPLWILSSNGASTKHPHLESVARVLHDCPGRKKLVFNYKTKYNDGWEDDTLMGDFDYEVEYGDGESAVKVPLL